MSLPGVIRPICWQCRKRPAKMAVTALCGKRLPACKRCGGQVAAKQWGTGHPEFTGAISVPLDTLSSGELAELVEAS